MSAVEFLLFVRLLSLNAVNGFENCQDTVTDKASGKGCPQSLPRDGS